MLHYVQGPATSDTDGSASFNVPIVESAWERQDGQPTSREHLLMALADVTQILIRANVVDGASRVG